MIIDSSKLVKNIRKQLGLTQEELAALISTNRCNIANYELGRAIPPGDVVLKLQQLLYPESTQRPEA